MIDLLFAHPFLTGLAFLVLYYVLAVATFHRLFRKDM